MKATEKGERAWRHWSSIARMTSAAAAAMIRDVTSASHPGMLCLVGAAAFAACSGTDPASDQKDLDPDSGLDAGGQTDSDTGASAPTTEPCPPYEPIDPHLSEARIRGACSTVGATCQTENGVGLCRGLPVGRGLAYERCTCNGEAWECLGYSLGKSPGCPLTPCEGGALKPEAAPAQPKTGLLYCAAGATCTTETFETCPDGTSGQTIDWSCSCDDQLAWMCQPTGRGDRSCP